MPRRGAFEPKEEEDRVFFRRPELRVVEDAADHQLGLRADFLPMTGDVSGVKAPANLSSKAEV